MHAMAREKKPEKGKDRNSDSIANADERPSERSFFRENLSRPQLSCPCGGGCPRCVQTKLAVGQPGDQYEQEADLVADAVVGMPVARAGHTEESENERVQLKTVPLDSPGIPVPDHLRDLIGSGQPLDEGTRTLMEPRFGHNFRTVRVHNDSMAAGSADSIGARAYTVGRDVVFGPGEYRPDTQPGQLLLAHELSHVIQQTAIAAGTAIVQKKEKEPASDRKDQMRAKLLANPELWMMFANDPAFEELLLEKPDIYHMLFEKFPKFQAWASPTVRQWGKKPEKEKVRIAPIRNEPAPEYQLSGEEINRSASLSGKKSPKSDSPKSDEKVNAGKLIDLSLTMNFLDDEALAERLELQVNANNYEPVLDALDKLRERDKSRMLSRLRKDWSGSGDEARVITALATRLSNFSMHQMAQLSQNKGPELLDRLYYGLVQSGEEGVSDQAARLAMAKASTLPVEKFVETGEKMLVIPHKSDDSLSVKRLGNEKLGLTLPLRYLQMFPEDTEKLRAQGKERSEPWRLPYMDVKEDEIIGLKDYDSGGRITYVPAYFLLQMRYKGLEKFRKQAGYSAEMALMLGTLGLAAPIGGAMEATLVTKALRALDLGVTTMSAITPIIDTNRNWLIEEFGDDGQEFLDIYFRIDSVLHIYGIARLAIDGAGLVALLASKAGNLYARVKSAKIFANRARAVENIKQNVDRIQDTARQLQQIRNSALKDAKAQLLAGPAANDNMESIGQAVQHRQPGPPAPSPTGEAKVVQFPKNPPGETYAGLQKVKPGSRPMTELPKHTPEPPLPEAHAQAMPAEAVQEEAMQGAVAVGQTHGASSSPGTFTRPAAEAIQAPTIASATKPPKPGASMQKTEPPPKSGSKATATPEAASKTGQPTGNVPKKTKAASSTGSSKSKPAGKGTSTAVRLDPVTKAPQQVHFPGKVVVGPAFNTFEEAFKNKAHDGAHIAEIILYDNEIDKNVLAHWWEVSESLADKGIHGVGRAGDTEQKALVRVFFKPGMYMEIHGMYQPCTVNKGCELAMQDVAKKTGAKILYRTPGAEPKPFPDPDLDYR